MFYKNARIFGADFQFHHGAFEVVNGKFGAILPETVPEDTTAREEIATAAPNAETSPAETDVEHSQAPVTIPESENTTDTVSQNGCASSVGVLSILVASLVAFAMKKKSH